LWHKIIPSGIFCLYPSSSRQPKFQEFFTNSFNHVQNDPKNRYLPKRLKVVGRTSDGPAGPQIGQTDHDAAQPKRMIEAADIRIGLLYAGLSISGPPVFLFNLNCFLTFSARPSQDSDLVLIQNKVKIRKLRILREKK
jgi:hypothetical protein